MKDLKRHIERIERGAAWDETDEVATVQVRKPLDKVIPIRLSAEVGIGPTTLARMRILERLRRKAKAAV